MKRRIMSIGGMLGLAQVVLGFASDPAPTNYFWGKVLGLPLTSREATFAPQEKKANFTFFDGVAKPRVEEGALQFTLATNKATLGWGNYMGRQSPAEMVKTPENWSQVLLKVRQSVPKTDWTLRCWRDGKRDGNPISQSLATNGWAELKFGFGNNLPPDGLEIEVSGEKGAVLEIAQVKAVSPAFEGWIRKEFTLPEAKVWQALAQVGGAVVVYINGTQVTGRRPEGHAAISLREMDIQPFLKPGKNVIAAHGLQWKSETYFLFQCRIAMESGEIVVLQTDETWKFSKTEAVGWNQPGFDDAKWPAATLNKGYLLKYLADYFTSYNQHHSLGSATRLRNPGRRDFFYGDDRDILMEVLVPAGLKDKAPVLEYMFAATDQAGKSLPVKEDKVTAFEARDNSLVFKINCGRQKGGVYTLAVTLKTKGGVVEERCREPLMVLSTITPKVVAGKDYFDGLNTELEDTIDFTNAKDPHPWFSAKPVTGPNWYKEPWIAISNAAVVTQDGLTYRETDPAHLAYFGCRIEFKHPGSWYLLELEYPDDAMRHVLVAINPTTFPEGAAPWEKSSWSSSGVGYDTGGKYYLTGKMQKLHWLHTAGSGVQVLYVQQGGGAAPAAAKALKIYRVKNECLPSIGGGMERQFGSLAERCTDYSGFAKNFGGDLPFVPQGPQATAKYSMIEHRVRYLQYLQRAAEKYIQYLRFSGQNTFIMGMFQYSEANTSYQPPYAYDTVEVMPEMRTVLANVLDRNGMNLYLNFEWITFDSLATTATDAEMARGADTVWRVNEFGEQKTSGAQVGARLQNWLHPKIQQRYYEVLRDYLGKFGHLKAFKGVHIPLNLATGMSGYYMPGLTEDTCYQKPLLWSYDDYTFAQFEKEAGLNLQIAKDDPQRFRKRALAVKNEEVRQRYITWRCQAFRNFLAGALAVLRAQRPETIAILPLANEHDDAFQYWLSTGRDYGDWLRDYAVDTKLLDATPGLGVGRWTQGIGIQYLARGGHDISPYMLLPKTDPRVYSAFGTGAFRHVQVRVSWDETCAVYGGCKLLDELRIVADNWIPNTVTIRTLPQLSGDNAREAFIEAIITGDPNSLMSGFTDLNLNVGHEQELRDVMKIFTRLPPEKFQPVLNTGLESNLAIRQLVKDGKTYVYVANPGYWFIKGSLTLSTSADILDFMTSQPVPVEKKDGKVILPVNLEPYGLAAFIVSDQLPVNSNQSQGEHSKIENRQSKILVESFATGAITERELAHMRAIAARVKQLMANAEIQLVLGKKDQAFMADSLARIDKALADRQYALAWSILTSCRFWLLWKDFLEKAEQGLARLPENLAREEPAGTPGELRVLTAQAATGPITVDGKLNEADWQKDKWSAAFKMKSGLPGMAETGVKALYDKDNLYLAFLCADRDVKALRGGPAWSWTDDELVVFLQPDETQPIYYQLGFNWGGGQFHQKVMAGERIYGKLPGWRPACTAADKYWMAEVMYPLATFGLKEKGPGHWRINCHRMVRDQLVDNASWNLEPGPWHEPLNGARQPFGRLAFQ